MSPLDAFSAYCDRHLLTNRPTVWVQYTDIWQEPRGELGHSDTTAEDLRLACFALLAPWAMIPTIGEAWLIVDWLEDLKVTRLRATAAGIFDPHWSVAYWMDDEGRLAFGDWEPETPMPAIAQAIAAAKDARFKQTFWEFDHTIESMVPVVQGLLP
jgi:hypothetical protein